MFESRGIPKTVIMCESKYAAFLQLQRQIPVTKWHFDHNLRIVVLSLLHLIQKLLTGRQANWANTADVGLLSEIHRELLLDNEWSRSDCFSWELADVLPWNTQKYMAGCGFQFEPYQNTIISAIFQLLLCSSQKYQTAGHQNDID